MPYYEKDAHAIAALASDFAALGLPAIRARKLNAILNAIEVQVEDEYADRRVVDSLFGSLSLAAESIDSPAGAQLRQQATDCRQHIAKRLSLRAVGGR